MNSRPIEENDHFERRVADALSSSSPSLAHVASLMTMMLPLRPQSRARTILESRLAVG